MILLLYNSVQKEQKANEIIVISLCDQIPGDGLRFFTWFISQRFNQYRVCLSFELTDTKRREVHIPQRQKVREVIGGLTRKLKCSFLLWYNKHYSVMRQGTGFLTKYFRTAFRVERSLQLSG
jgi:hypothetical protein